MTGRKGRTPHTKRLPKRDHGHHCQLKSDYMPSLALLTERVVKHEILVCADITFQCMAIANIIGC